MINCIICLLDEDEPIQVYNLDTLVTLDNKLNMNLSEIIYLVANIKFKFIKSMCNICSRCVKEAMQAYNFKQLCINAEKQQIEYLNTADMTLEHPIKIEDDEIEISETSVNYSEDNNSYLHYNLLLQDEPKQDLPSDSNNTIIENIIEDINLDEGATSLDESIALVNENNNDSFKDSSSHIEKEYQKPELTRADFEKYDDQSQINNQVENVELHSCLMCNKAFIKKKQLLDHISKHHPAAKTANEFTCPECNKIFKYRSHLKHHLPCSGAGSYVCPYCTFSTSVILGYTDHLNKSHPELKTYNCKQCSFSTSFEFSLKYHMKNSHKEAGRFQCSICSYKATTKKLLDAHVKLPHCPRCAGAFASAYSLKTHMESKHSDTSIFICDFCAKFYNSDSKLRRHILNRHRELRPFKCSQCPSAFSKKDERSNHEKLHAPLKQCKDCWETFKTYQGYVCHQNKMHGGNIKKIENDNPIEVRIYEENEIIEESKNLISIS